MSLLTLDNWISSSQSSPVFGDEVTLDHWILASISAPVFVDEEESTATSLTSLTSQTSQTSLTTTSTTLTSQTSVTSLTSTSTTPTSATSATSATSQTTLTSQSSLTSQTSTSTSLSSTSTSQTSQTSQTTSSSLTTTSGQPPPDIRGSWTLDEAVESRWDSAGLDSTFRSYWTDSAITEYPTLCDDEAPHGQPGPYCVVEKGPSVVDGGDSGETSTTGKQRHRITVTFTIHAKDSTTQTGKAIAAALADEVKDAFDWAYGALSISPDSHLKTEEIGDWGVQESDDYAWVVMYEVTIEGTETLLSP